MCSFDSSVERRRAEAGYTCACRAGFFGNAYDPVAGCAPIDSSRALLVQGTLCLPVAYLETLAPAYSYSLDFRAAVLEAESLLELVLNTSHGYLLDSVQVTAFSCAPPPTCFVFVTICSHHTYSD